MNGEKTRKVKCPTCGKEALYSPENRFRPFCCERCSTLDLGAWAEERYKVPAFEKDSLPVNENSDDESAFEDHLPPKHHLN